MDSKLRQMCFRISVCIFVLAAVIVTTRSEAQSGHGSAAGSSVEQRVQSILDQMTLEEKIDLLGGVEGFFVAGNQRLGLPKLKMADGPMGVRNYGPATALGGIGLAATWNPALAEQVGTQIGRDARAKGVHFLLGPGVNIYRSPLNGRNFEYFGEDPILASRIAVGYIRGVQSQGVSATVKHYMGNNSEFDRHNTDSIIDERTMREIYLPAFEAAVKEAHVGAIMDSYNLTNGEHLTQNAYLNTEVAKKEWGFDGIMMSDWFATYDGVAAANSGLDLEMPAGTHLNRKTLLPALNAGTVSVATIDDKVRRILRVAVEFGWLDRDQTDIFIPRDNEQGRAAALETACEGLVMLKNEGGVLPLNKDQLRSVAVIGPDAYPAVPVAGGSARVEPFAAVSFLQGLSDRLGPVVPVYYHRGLPTLSELADRTPFSTVETGGSSGLNAEYFSNADLQGSPIVTRVESHVNIGRPREDFGGGAPNAFPDHTASERFTGYYKPQSPGDYEVFVQSTGEGGGFYRLYIDDKLIFDDWKSAKQFLSNVKIPMEARPYKIVLEHHGRGSWLGNRLKLGIVAAKGMVASEAKAMAAKADAVVVAVGFEPEIESEGGDRMFQLPPGQAELIREIAAANKNTIVVVTSGGGVDMTGWLDRVPALIEAWYPGQEGGAALADVLTGAVNPSGRLPITFDRRWEDNPSHDSYYPLDAASNRVVYSEGVFVGYRGYDASGKTPAFPFGYGLSYTSFSYSKLSIGGVGSDGNFTVSFDVTNTGNRQGSDVAQVYVGEPHPAVKRPEKELKGFEKVNLRPGETKRVSITLGQRALSYYDVTSKDWRVDPGEFDVMIGRSAGEIVLMGKLTVAKASARR